MSIPRVYTIISLIFAFALTGCFATTPTHGELLPISGSSSVQDRGEPSNAELMGAVGAAAGTILVKKAPVAGAVILGGVGYVAGRSQDRRDAAVGRTTCNYRAQKSGQDANGVFGQDVIATKTVPGYGTNCGK
jgi:hypothetical protein